MTENSVKARNLKEKIMYKKQTVVTRRKCNPNILKRAGNFQRQPPSLVGELRCRYEPNFGEYKAPTAPGADLPGVPEPTAPATSRLELFPDVRLELRSRYPGHGRGCDDRSSSKDDCSKEGNSRVQDQAMELLKESPFDCLPAK